MTATAARAAAASPASDLEVGRKVLDMEIQGLQALSDALGEPFVRAVELIGSLKGRLIVTGMGKSGHIARKMAATFASTGTPSFFVHPGEASHGDMGMITEDDGLLMLSNSGETSELKDLIHYSRRFRIPLVSMVRRKTSALVDASDVALVLPETPEALDAGAPSTSTTMMLALGDALAGCLMTRRGFTAEDFHVFHPGGKLGKRFIKVSELMRGGEWLPIVSPAMTMEEVIPVITEKALGLAVVTRPDGTLAGIITDGDLRRHMGPGLLSMTAEEVMTADPKSIRPNALAVEALGIMNEKNITALMVVENDRPVGIIHIHHCLMAGVG